METLIAPVGFTNSIVCTIHDVDLCIALGLTIGLILITVYENRN